MLDRASDPVNRDLEIRDHLQHGGRVRAPPGLPRRLPLPAQRHADVLRRAGRQDGLAAGRAGRSPIDGPVAGRLPGGRRLEAVRRGGLSGDRAGAAARRRPRDLRRPVVEPRHGRLVPHPPRQQRQRSADHRRRRSCDRPRFSHLPVPAAAEPQSAGHAAVLPGSQHRRRPKPSPARQDRDRVARCPRGAQPCNAPTPIRRRPGGATAIRTTDGTIALLNLQAQIESLELLAAREPLRTARGSISSTCLPFAGSSWAGLSTTSGPRRWRSNWRTLPPADGLAFLTRARTRATFHRFADALADLERAERLGMHPVVPGRRACGRPAPARPRR